MKKYKVGIVGATGMVGRTIISILEQRKFPTDSLRLFASSKSKGKKLKFCNGSITVEELKQDKLKGFDIVFFSAGGEVSRIYCPIATRNGGIVIDNSSYWRMNKDVPLVVPEVNPEALKNHNGIISNPNCSTIQLVVVLNPIHKMAKIKRIVISTYQAVSGKGYKAMLELKSQIRNSKSKIRVFPHKIAFNVIPQIDEFVKGYTKEEWKMINETKKIMQDETIKITATCARVPIMNCHSESVNIETERKLSANDVKKILKRTKGVIVFDNDRYPMPIITDGKDKCFVGRIREDDSIRNGINLWIVADNLRKGAALNAVQIAELLI